MTDRRAVIGVLLAGLVALPGSPQAAGAQAGAPAAAAGAEFSAGERLLWLQPHLENITRPTRLRYRFVKSGSLEEGFEDQVIVDVVAVHDDGTRDAAVTFFTGERQHFVPFKEHVTGNPVLGVYLLGDMYEMNRLATGSWQYFMRRMKFAFADARTLGSGTVSWQGQELPAQVLEVTPYVRDPHREEMAEFADKRYRFVFSRAVPGQLYEIHDVVPATEPGAPPLVEQRLVLESVEPIPQAEAVRIAAAARAAKAAAARAPQ